MPLDLFQEITIVDPHLEKQYINDKLGVVDLRVLTKRKDTYHIEIQLAPMKEMAERMIYYNSKLLVNQIKEGDNYGKLNKVISILLVDYIMYEDEYCHSCFKWYDEKTNKMLSDLVEINVIELKKIDKLKLGDKYNWIKFLNSTEKEDFDMLAEAKPIFRDAVSRLAILSEDERNRMIADDREKAIRDEDARRRYAEEKGFNVGLERGLEQGIEQGIEQNSFEVALRLLKLGTNIEIIKIATNLSEEKIIELKSKI